MRCREYFQYFFQSYCLEVNGVDRYGSQRNIFQLMAWCRQTKIQCLTEWWLKYMTPHGVTMCQDIKLWYLGVTNCGNWLSEASWKMLCLDFIFQTKPCAKHYIVLILWYTTPNSMMPYSSMLCISEQKIQLGPYNYMTLSIIQLSLDNH